MMHSEIIEKYQGVKLSLDSMSEYQQWAMPFFHNDDYVANPNLSITLSLELKEARQVYDSAFKIASGASFQCYLAFNLIKAMNEHWIFNTRQIDGDWYLFKNLPLYFPIAIGGAARFKDVFIENVTSLNWSDFARDYRFAIENTGKSFEQADPLSWGVATFIGNLPYLNFSSFTIHRSNLKMARPYFYFGQRRLYNDAGSGELSRYEVPMSITIDHANADPFILDVLLKTFQENLVKGQPLIRNHF